MRATPESQDVENLIRTGELQIGGTVDVERWSYNTKHRGGKQTTKTIHDIKFDDIDRIFIQFEEIGGWFYVRGGNMSRQHQHISVNVKGELIRKRLPPATFVTYKHLWG